MNTKADKVTSHDTFSAEKRTAIMRSVRNSGTDIELALRRLLWQEGLRYRVNLRVHGCRPDIAFVRKQVAVFVDGCFWHGCPKHYQAPKSNFGFWNAKVRKNIDRDRMVTQRLRESGWKVLRFWECDIKYDMEKVLAEIVSCVR